MDSRNLGNGISLMIVNPDGSVSDLTKAADFTTDAEGVTTPNCDCPPGMCGEFDPLSVIFDIMSAAGPTGDEVEIEIEAEDEDLAEEYRADAIAQLGRITEDLTEVVGIHARLVAELVGR